MAQARRFVRILITALMLLTTVAPSLGPAVALAQTATPTATPEPAGEAAPSGGTELTIYNQSLGLVREVRTADLAAGVNSISVTDIPSHIVPASIFIQMLTDAAGTSLMEQTYQYDTVDSSSLLQRYIDQEIGLTMQDGRILAGTLASVGDDVVLLTEYGIEVVRRSQIDQFSLPMPTEALITRPTLSWLMEATKAGPREFRVTYLTSGITWQADYVVLLSQDATSMDLTSWITINNNSGASYPEAKLKLVAGDVNQVDNQVAYSRAVMYDSMEAESSSGVQERSLMDYHLYDVARPVTVEDGQSKQLEFLRAGDIDVEKEYVYEVTPEIYVRLGNAVTDSGYGLSDSTDVQVQLQLVNDEESGLGVPLPAGTVRVYTEDVDGATVLIGEDTIDHTPANETVRLSLGNAFDLVGERVQTEFRKLSDRSLEETIELTLRNQSDNDVTIQALEHLYRAHDATVTESSMDYTEVDAPTIRFDVPVKSGESQTVTYTVVYRW